jgi:large subunit ribosomal protein L3
MKALLGRKIGMSQTFSPTGEAIPVTLIQAEPNVVTLRRKSDVDGYAAVQLTLPAKKENRYIARSEFKGTFDEATTQLTVAQFVPGDKVEVTGISKGKGFQGVVKRHGFKGGPASHGHTDWERRPGSIGQRFPQHTMKGKRMPGRMGADQVTVKNLQVVTVDANMHLLAVKGAVPGPRGSVVAIRCREEKE